MWLAGAWICCPYYYLGREEEVAPTSGTQQAFSPLTFGGSLSQPVAGCIHYILTQQVVSEIVDF